MQSYLHAVADDMGAANFELRRAACGAKNKRGRTPAHSACASGAPATRGVRTLAFLLELGARPDEPDAEGFTPLHVACARGAEAAAKALVARGADAAKGDARGRAPLDLAPKGFDVASVIVGKMDVAEMRLRAAPTIKPHCTYLHLFMDRLDGLADLRDPYLRLMVRDAKNRPVEKDQHAATPSLHRGATVVVGATSSHAERDVFVSALASSVSPRRRTTARTSRPRASAATRLHGISARRPRRSSAIRPRTDPPETAGVAARRYHLQEAVEDLSYGCFLLIEVVSRTEEGDVVAAWARRPLTADFLRPDAHALEFFTPPFDPGNDLAATPADAFLAVDVWLSRLPGYERATAVPDAPGRLDGHRVDII